MGYLETVQVHRPGGDNLVFPVQWDNRPDSTFCGFSGSVASGRVRPGDEVRVTASGQTAKVAEIVTMDGSTQEARTGDAVTLRLDREIDPRGDVLSLAASPLN
jgi:bifunctional enzyme CysN/CysC